MAFTPNKYLKTRDPTAFVYLRDQRHASRLFADDSFRLAPKFSHLFHVSFSINPAALKSIDLLQRHRNEINMLVKSITLPKFTISAETANQYNRKKVIQTQYKFENATIKFHDDNMGLINHLWQAYWSYYYADARSATNPGAYARNAMKNYASAMPNPYGFDNGSSQPFFNYIKIYQMARHEYVCYKIINPLVTSWNYGKVSYSDQGIHDFDMKLSYEAVTFSVGTVTPGDPEGFALQDSHYDLTPSPLKGPNPDPTVNNPSFVKSIDTTGLAPGILANAINSVNENQNSGGALGNVAGGIALATAGVGIFNALGGVAGIGSAIGGAIDAVSGAVGGAIDAVGGAIGDISTSVGEAVGGISDAIFPGSDRNSSPAPSDLDDFYG